jgi:HSP90 family molecular chaperone
MEVLFVYTNLDDFVMGNAIEYAGKPIKSIESANLDIKPEEVKILD